MPEPVAISTKGIVERISIVKSPDKYSRAMSLGYQTSSPIVLLK
jgi:hypothetical protein